MIKGIQKIEYLDLKETPREIKSEKGKQTEERKFGLFSKILESGKKFIRDDIKDEDFLK